LAGVGAAVCGRRCRRRGGRRVGGRVVRGIQGVEVGVADALNDEVDGLLGVVLVGLAGGGVAVVEPLQAGGLASGGEDEVEQAGGLSPNPSPCAGRGARGLTPGPSRCAGCGGRGGGLGLGGSLGNGEEIPGGGLQALLSSQGAREGEGTVGAAVGLDLLVDGVDVAGGGLAVDAQGAGDGGVGVALAEEVPAAVGQGQGAGLSPDPSPCAARGGSGAERAIRQAAVCRRIRGSGGAGGGC
jgi:hypothetical protein